MEAALCQQLIWSCWSRSRDLHEISSLLQGSSVTVLCTGCLSVLILELNKLLISSSLLPSWWWWRKKTKIARSSNTIKLDNLSILSFMNQTACINVLGGPVYRLHLLWLGLEIPTELYLCPFWISVFVLWLNVRWFPFKVKGVEMLMLAVQFSFVREEQCYQIHISIY